MLIILVFSHDFSSDSRYSDMTYYKKMEQKAIDYYVKSKVEYRLIKYNPDIDNVYEEKENIFYIKGDEAYDIETCNYKDKIAFNYYKNYKYIYKTTVTALPNIHIIHDTIINFEKKNNEILYCGPTFIGHGKLFVGGFSLLLNNKAMDIILNEEWTTNDDESIGNILRNHMLQMPYWANHNHNGEYDKNITYRDVFSIKFVMYKEHRLPEKDYILHDIVTTEFLGLLKL